MAIDAHHITLFVEHFVMRNTIKLEQLTQQLIVGTRQSVGIIVLQMLGHIFLIGFFGRLVIIGDEHKGYFRVLTQSRTGG